jgi:hypothetical protein
MKEIALIHKSFVGLEGAGGVWYIQFSEAVGDILDTLKFG